MIDPHLIAVAEWTTSPLAVQSTESALSVTARGGSDAWCTTSYGVVHDDAHARVDDEPFQLVRVAYLDPALHIAAGPYCCSPTRAGLTVSFTGWVRTPPDDTLHCLRTRRHTLARPLLRRWVAPVDDVVGRRQDP